MAMDNIRRYIAFHVPGIEEKLSRARAKAILEGGKNKATFAGAKKEGCGSCVPCLLLIKCKFVFVGIRSVFIQRKCSKRIQKEFL